MGGLFGGLLFFFEVIGGLILSGLVGRKAAWSDKNEAFTIRLVIASILIGGAIGWILTLFISTNSGGPFVPIFTSIVLTMTVALVLGALKISLEGKN
jgi:fatty acid desaturase